MNVQHPPLIRPSPRLKLVLYLSAYLSDFGSSFTFTLQCPKIFSFADKVTSKDVGSEQGVVSSHESMEYFTLPLQSLRGF
jgi:hypothetical protein